MTTPATDNPAQRAFDERYITAAEICTTLGVSRTAVLGARQRGLLPEPINVNDGMLYIWERATVAPYLDAWTTIIRVRRGATL
jgi:hypothetical protein